MTDSQITFFPPTPDRAAAIAAGFRFGHIGTHTSRTIMLKELEAIFAAVSEDARQPAYAKAVIEENCLGKETVSTRRLTFQRLRELYAFDLSVPIFRILRHWWNLDRQGQSFFALLSALARDPLLLATADVVIKLPDGAEFQRSAMREALSRAVKDRLNESTLNKVVRNAASSWSQCGHLQGRTFKFRRLVRATPAAVAFSLYLSVAAGLPGKEALSSGWMRALDCSASDALEMATAAKRIGLLDLRMAGDVLDLNLDRLDPYFSTPARVR